jgi:superfamily II DNA or RNA helicase
MTATKWRVGDRLTHPFDPELGVGVVRAVDGRLLRVFFAAQERELTLSAQSGLIRLGTDAPARHAASPLERLAALRTDSPGAFRNRIAGRELARLREAGGLGSFLGGRIELYPHQLHTALRAVERDPVRWLLADEVGLGKTIEACLVLSALVRTGRAQRALVIAPDTLAVQWLGELYRKFHQVFTLLDADRLDAVAREFGDDFNPFVAHRNAVISFERLAGSRTLLAHALDSEPDLVLVDEAHRLADPEFGAALGPLVQHARHALLLTATPLAEELRGFHALLALLHPEDFASYPAFQRAIDGGQAVLPCTSAVRREDLGGFPPRRPQRIDLEAAQGDLARDPRALWLTTRAAEWRARGEKALVFVSQLALLEALERHLTRATGEAPTVFHEALDLEERDIRLARFREGEQPLLLCSEAGSEGRNFQFCERMVHWDLPRDPVRLEQRIGRLDRIGRRQPVEIVYFRCAGDRPDLATLYERLGLFATPSAGIDAALAGVREAIERADGGARLDIDALERALVQARTSATRGAPRALYPDAYAPSKADAVLARIPPDLEQRMQAYCVEAAPALGLKVVPKSGTARYYIELPAKAGRSDGGTDRASELATADWGALLTRVESLPGVGVHALPGYGDEVRFLGTFDREEAIQNQSLAFFASGQMLVEGLMLELEDGARGRAALLEIPESGHSGSSGLLCVFRQGPDWTAVAVDEQGRLQPSFATAVLEGLPRARPLRLQPTPRFAQQVQKLGEIAHGACSDGALDAAVWFRLS